jgi:hypothetical protein
VLIAQAGQTVTRTVTQTVGGPGNFTVEAGGGGPPWGVLVGVAFITAGAVIIAAMIAARSARERLGDELKSAEKRASDELAHEAERQRAQLAHDHDRQQATFEAQARATDLAVLRELLAELVENVHAIETELANVRTRARSALVEDGMPNRELRLAVGNASNLAGDSMRWSLRLALHLGVSDPITEAHAEFRDEVHEFLAIAHAMAHSDEVEASDVEALDDLSRATAAATLMELAHEAARLSR